MLRAVHSPAACHLPPHLPLLQALWSLLGEDPALAATVVGLSRHVAGSDGSDAALEALDMAHVRLPEPASPLAARLRRLGRVAARAGASRIALLCYDLAGPWSGA